ncbi:MAG: isoprenylcysteine carboxylmethyltransferase family protein [Candidatus Dormibacteraeota bacterium]|nr:isoprenylcysteine carboxylmethyltransferase family protein [Candidatus Dormibacteraeota bacterium]MBO0762054.1 isoprenylcysteine carboxylmethyltransferase family protein [Candidatus Dormibacteraeota bacterium]
MELRTLAQISVWCLDGVGIVWLGTAIWFAARRPATLASKIWHFLRTVLPEPWMLLALAVLLVLLRVVVPPHDWRPLMFREPWLQAFGAVLIIGASIFMVWARLALGDMWAARPMVQEGHELRTGGPYGLVRHPIYTGMIGAVLGLMLLTGFGSTIFVFMLVFTWLGWRVHVEDRMMLDTFGDRYRAYQQQVRALLPVPRRPAHA